MPRVVIHLNEDEIKEAVRYYISMTMEGFGTASADDVKLTVTEASRDGPVYAPGFVSAEVTTNKET